MYDWYTTYFPTASHKEIRDDDVEHICTQRVCKLISCDVVNNADLKWAAKESTIDYESCTKALYKNIGLGIIVLPFFDCTKDRKFEEL